MNVINTVSQIESINGSSKKNTLNTDIQEKISNDTKKNQTNNEILDIKIEAIVNLTPAESSKKVQESFDKHGTQPKAIATTTFNVMENELDSINKDISDYNPAIKSTDWDFTYKDKKLYVTGDKLNENDKKFIQDKLDKNLVINESVKLYNTAVVNYYQQAKEDWHNGPSSKHGGISTKIYLNVQDQINKGVFSYKKLMQESINTNENIKVSNKYNAAIQAPEDYLTASVDTYA